MPAAIRFVCVAAVLLLTGAASAQAQPCSFAITPTSATFGASGGDGLITMTASAGNCARTVTSGASWLTLNYGQEGTGNGTASYHVAANNTPNQRTGTLNVAGQVFTVTQSAGTCSVQLNPTRATVGATGGSGQFDVMTGCAWSASTAASWITLTQSSGSGNGKVRWTASANTTASARSGTITIGSQSFTITQEASCVFTLVANNGNFPAAGGTGTITVQGPTGCERTAQTDVSWIRITSGATGEGNGTINITVEANTARQTRLGMIRINGAYTTVITQDANTCVVILNPTQASGNVSGGSGVFAVSAACAWTAVAKSDWVRIVSGSGTGSGTVQYEYGANYSAIARGGFIDVNGATFVIQQPAAACDIDVSPSTLPDIPVEGASGVLTISTAPDCDWRATTSHDWITLESKASGLGSGELRYRIAANPTVTTRSGTISVGSAIISVRQAAAGCSVSIGSATTLQVPADGGSGSIPITANCAWRAIPSADWIRVTSSATGSSDATLTFTVSQNSAADERRGTITIGSHTFTVAQQGQRCSVTLSETTAMLPGRGGSGVIPITGGTACVWSAASTVEWLRVEWSSVSGSGNVRFFASANATGAERTGTISVSGQTITVRQAALSLQITAQGIVNAASFAGGAVAPGEIVTIAGSGFGPSALATYQLTPDGQGLTAVVGETRVLFDGRPAPMIYATEGQISAVASYSVAPNQTTAIEVEYAGVRSNAVMLPVAASAPGIFTVAATGSGQAAVLNQDSTPNSRDNAAARGSIVQIFATGEGQTRPGGVDGKLASAPLPVPVLPVTVRIGGLDAPVVYAGAAPGAVAGLLQVNARIPEGVVAGPDVPIVIRVGETESRPGTTIAVR